MVDAVSFGGKMYASKEIPYIKKQTLLTRVNLRGPFMAGYMFGGRGEGEFLSHFIDSRITFVNHIPAQILGEHLLGSHVRSRTTHLLLSSWTECSTIHPYAES